MHPRVAPTWIHKYVGLKFGDKGRGPDEFDCWGLVRWIYMQEHKLTLPDYLEGYEHVADDKGVASSIRSGLEDGWIQIDKPEEKALVIFNIFGKPVHVGIVVYNDYFLHSPQGDASRLERLGDRNWARRVEGFYRHAALSGPGQASPA